MNEHIPYDQLIDMLTAAREKVPVATEWQHYKGGRYVVNDIVIIEATDEVAVLYSSLDHPNVAFVRPITAWLETVERNGQASPRFVKIY